MTIELSKTLKLPSDAVTQTFAFLARKGGGKSYGAMKLAEELHAAKAQFVTLDPVGVWWGLRLAADGKAKGINIPVFGGLHGDLPLEPTSGAVIASLIIDKGISAVVDVSMFTQGEMKRFAVDFAERFFHDKKSTRTPVHLFVEEAQTFVPQHPQKDEHRMLGAFERIVKLGRNFGIGVTLISQRPQAVNKEALNQTECLVVLQTNGAHERKALAAWIVEAGIDVEGLVDTLPGLTRGEAWVWSPSWLKVTKRIHIAKKWTFDSSATPVAGKKQKAPKELSAVDLDEVRKALKASIDRATQNDPRELRAKIQKLEAQLRDQPISCVLDEPFDLAAVRRGDVRQMKETTVVKKVPMIKEADLKRLEKLVARGQDAVAALQKAAVALQTTVTVARGSKNDGLAPTPLQDAFRGPMPQTPPARVLSLPKGHTPPVRPLLDGEVSIYARLLLKTLAERHPMQLAAGQLAALSGRSARSSAFANAMAELRRHQLIQANGARQLLTESGRKLVGAVAQVGTTREEIKQGWLRVLPDYERVLLATLFDRGDAGATNEDLSAITGRSSNSSAFANALASLRRNNLIEKGPNGINIVSPSLFEGVN